MSEGSSCRLSLTVWRVNTSLPERETVCLYSIIRVECTFPAIEHSLQHISPHFMMHCGEIVPHILLGVYQFVYTNYTKAHSFLMCNQHSLSAESFFLRFQPLSRTSRVYEWHWMESGLLDGMFTYVCIHNTYIYICVYKGIYEPTKLLLNCTL